MHNSNKTDAGFTIIEVLIVISIAGLIMLIVFQIMPSLLRNSRNNARRQDVAIILQALTRYQLNNSGDFPPDITSGINFMANSADRLSMYTASTDTTQNEVIVVTPPAAGSATAQPALTVTDRVFIHNYQKCDTNTSGATTPQGAGYNDVVALFAIETASGIQGQCVEK